MKRSTKLVTSFLFLFVTVAYGQNFRNMGNHNYLGVPDYLDPNREYIGPSLLADLGVLLPDGENLPVNNPSLYKENTMKAITLSQPGNVYLAFVSEGADFKSAVGFYTYKGNPPSHPYLINSYKIVFPNVSGNNSGGGLQQGDRVNLGYFEEGTSIGFFLISNAFRYGRVMPFGNDVFYTDPQFNPEIKSELKKHAVLLYDQVSDRYVLMFEDFNRSGGSDHDFNDAVFVVSANPNTFSKEGATVIQTAKEEKLGKTPVEKMITICHFPPGNRENAQLLTISENAWPAHQAHGDELGNCTEMDGIPDFEGTARYDLKGDWQLTGRDQTNTVQVTREGIQVQSDNSSKWFEYKYFDTNTYRDDLGNFYVFHSKDVAVWISSDGKTIISLYRIVEDELNEEEVEPDPVEEVRRITICHYPPGNPYNPQEIEIPESAWLAHEAHGDVQGNCDGSEPEEEGEKITICHYPPGNPYNPIEIKISESAWEAHEAHGDVLGNCDGTDAGENQEKKIRICHYPPGNRDNPQEIMIPESAWKAHEAHGDTKGKCRKK